VRVALVSDPDWRAAVPEARSRGADIVCLPHLSFAPYVAATRDRAGLEQAERAPSALFAEALDLAAGAWLSASAYESEGEGVFYVTARIAGPDGTEGGYRQRQPEAAEGRFEQMFWLPGHEPPALAALPWGPTAALVGYDLRIPGAWPAMARAGARVVLGGASEPPALWEQTTRIAAGMAAAHGLTALIANRGDAGFAGGGVAFGPGGEELAVDEDGLVTA
jgi:N-carbamoylputrescine amidase